MKRVLKANGGFWIGTPNRTRLIGYIGSKDANLTQKFKWNITDWKARLKGKFRNEFGAHAGYSSKELFDLLSNTFSKTKEVTNNYYYEVYKNQHFLIKCIVNCSNHFFFRLIINF